MPPGLRMRPSSCLGRVWGPLIDLGCGPGGLRSNWRRRQTVRWRARLTLQFRLRGGMAADIQATGRRGTRSGGSDWSNQSRRITAKEHREANVTAWCAHVTALPFPGASFAAGVSLNLLDSVPNPLAHLQEAARVIEPGGKLVIASPYEWTSQATAIEQWIGGHSQRGPMGGASDATMRQISRRARSLDSRLAGRFGR